MSWTDLAFWVFGIAAIWYGWRVFRTDSMVRATFALLASFLNVGAIMLLLLGEYLGTSLFFMMTAEMLVMAIFMVAFMMNPAGLNPMSMVHQERSAIVAGVAVFAGLVAVALLADFPSAPLSDPDATIRALGSELMGDSMLVMQSVGVTLLATMIGASILSAKHGRFGDADAGSEPPLLDPDDPQSRRAGDRPATDGGHHHHGGHDTHGGHGHGGHG